MTAKNTNPLAEDVYKRQLTREHKRKKTKKCLEIISERCHEEEDGFLFNTVTRVDRQVHRCDSGEKKAKYGIPALRFFTLQEIQNATIRKKVLLALFWGQIHAYDNVPGSWRDTHRAVSYTHLDVYKRQI